jgi:hypothetical protein
MIPQHIDEEGRITTYVLAGSLFYGAIGLFAVLNLILLKRHIWKYVFLLLILSSFSSYLDLVGYVHLSILYIDLIALSILILHLVFNTDMAYSILNFFKPSNEEIQQIEKSQQGSFEYRISKFEQKFANKSENELLSIIQENQFIPEAIEASKRLLKTKKEHCKQCSFLKLRKTRKDTSYHLAAHILILIS